MHGFWPTVPGRKLHIYDFGICQYVYCVLFKHKMKNKLIWYNHNFMLYGRCTNCIMTVTKISISPSHYIKSLHSAAHQGFLDAARSILVASAGYDSVSRRLLVSVSCPLPGHGEAPSHPIQPPHSTPGAQCAVKQPLL